MKKKIGLADLLVVFGIGILLILIFCPIIDPVRPDTYRRHCSNNIIKISIALEMYHAQNNKQYPISNGDKGLHCLIQDINSKESFNCPEFQKQKKTLWDKAFGSVSETSEFKSDFMYLGGFSENEKLAVPILFDKIGNHKNYCNVLFSDRKLEGFNLQYSTYDDLVKYISEKEGYSPETIDIIKQKIDDALENNNLQEKKKVGN